MIGQYIAIFYSLQDHLTYSDSTIDILTFWVLWYRQKFSIQWQNYIITIMQCYMYTNTIYGNQAQW